MSILILAAVAAASPSAPVRVPPPPIVYAPPRKPVDPAVLASAKKLLAMMHVDAVIDQMMTDLVPLMAPAVMNALEHGDTTRTAMQKMETQPNGRERLMVIFTEEFQKAFRSCYPAMIGAAAEEYAAVFSAPELDQAIAFYSTGAGAKFLALSPRLQQVVGNRSRQIGQEAGRAAGFRAMQRAVQELLPSEKTVS